MANSEPRGSVTLRPTPPALESGAAAAATSPAPAATGALLSPQTRRSLRETFSAYAMLAPALLVIVGFSFVPMVWSILDSFQDGGLLGEKEFVGLQNYAQALENPIFLRTLGNTVRYALMVVPAVILVSLAAAIILTRLRRLQGFFRGAMYFPVIVPAVIAANTWAYIVNRDFGPLNYALGWLGIPRIDWLGDPNWAIPAIVLMEIWRGFGFYVIIFVAAIQAIPRELYEAARLDGASEWRHVTSITVPLLRPVLGFAFVIATIWNFQIFDAVYVLTQGGPAWATSTVSWFVYQQAFQSGNVGLASTMSVFLLVIILTLSLIQLRFFRGDIEY